MTSWRQSNIPIFLITHNVFVATCQLWMASGRVHARTGVRTFSQRSVKFLKYKTDMELSNEVWWMKKSGQTPVITWKIVQRCSPCNSNSKRWYLCLNEQLEIATYQGNNLLNKKTEVISKCRHQNKYTLSKYDKVLYCNFLFVNHIWLKIVK